MGTRWTVDISVEEVEKFKELFAMVDTPYNGFLGHGQFTDLLKLLGVDVDNDTLHKMFKDMDENDDGEIEFDGAMHTIVYLGRAGAVRWCRVQTVWFHWCDCLA